MAFAKGRNAFGFCDRCGFRYPLKQLKAEVVDQVVTDVLVCSTCYDEDHPQLYMVNEVETNDAIGLENPRPDRDLNASRSLYGFNPIRGFKLTVAVGTVRVTTT